MAVNANTLITMANKLDWATCAVLGVVGVCLLIAGQTTYAWLALGAAAFSGLTAWLNPARRLMRLLERNMLRKRASS